MLFKSLKWEVLCLFLLLPFFHFSQEIPIGTWRDHLPYVDAVSITYGNNTVYCATNSAVFTYDLNDKTIERLNLVNGLSDIGMSKIKFNPYNNKVILTYINGNIDIINEDKSILNLSFIKNSSIVGSKTINHIYLQGKYAYISTGFGIVLLDTDELEIVDTYFFGPSGSSIFTNGITMDTSFIYAATDQGVFYADKTSTTLVDFNSWNIIPELGTIKYDNIAFFSGRLFVSSDSPIWNADSIFYNDGGIWQKFITGGFNVEEFNVSSEYFSISYLAWVEKYDLLLNSQLFYTYNGLFDLTPKEVDLDGEGYLLIADNSHGIIRAKSNSNAEIIVPNGPSSANVFKMDFSEGDLWSVSGGYNELTYGPIGIKENIINAKIDNSWINPSGALSGIADASTVIINPKNPSQVFVGCWDHGLLEFSNGHLINTLTAQNSILDSTFFGTTKVADIEFDKEDNLWVLNSFTNNPLVTKTSSNDWFSYSFPGINSANVLTHLVIDQSNYKWIAEPMDKKVLIFDDNNTISDKSDDRFVTNNNIPGTRITALVEDLDGEIWIGTDEGIAVFYNPSLVFEEDIEAEQIFIQQDGQTQILLETETISAIAIDGANRKWIGTRSSGVFLMNENGTEEIEHFSTQNSPLFSNSIFDIVIDPKTGEVFFGTEKGLISYKGTATSANEDFNNILVYPNPVRPGFDGTIAIRGLVKDTDVRITDISGNIVFQTTSLGGQAVWDGKDIHGNKIHTGVYLVFNGSPDGNQKAAAKILFIR